MGVKRWMRRTFRRKRTYNIVSLAPLTKQDLLDEAQKWKSLPVRRLRPSDPDMGFYKRMANYTLVLF